MVNAPQSRMGELRKRTQAASTIRSRVWAERARRTGLSYWRAEPAGSAKGSGQRLPTADGGGGSKLGPAHVHLPGREPGEELLEGDPAFEPGQCRSQAQVDAVAEGQGLALAPVDVEGVAVGEATVVVVGRSQQEHHDAA